MYMYMQAVFTGAFSKMLKRHEKNANGLQSLKNSCHMLEYKERETQLASTGINELCGLLFNE